MKGDLNGTMKEELQLLKVSTLFALQLIEVKILLTEVCEIIVIDFEILVL